MLQLQKQLTSTDSERRVTAERLESLQSSLNELRHVNQTLGDQNTRLQNELANSEVLRSGLESQLRLSNWPSETIKTCCADNREEEELMRQLQSTKRERSELRVKTDTLNDKV